MARGSRRWKGTRHYLRFFFFFHSRVMNRRGFFSGVFDAVHKYLRFPAVGIKSEKFSAYRVFFVRFRNA